MTQLMKHLWKRDVTQEELAVVGERVWNLGRLYNLREGVEKKDDYVPKAMLDKPFKTGVSAGKTIGSEHFAAIMDEYYAARGWDKDAVPTEEKLQQLGIDVRLPVDNR